MNDLMNTRTEVAQVMESIDRLMAEQRAFFGTGQTRSYEFRVQQLKRLRAAIKEREDQVLEALRADMGRAAFEGYVAEVSFMYAEIDHTLKRLRSWMRPQRVPTPLLLQPSSSMIMSEPLGQVLIITPWNYPFQLAMAPLVGALAAGNVAVVKPSELAPHTARLITELIGATFPPELVATVEGGVEVSQALLARRWDHIFFTGSTAVGRIVAKAAAEHLTPVTLELGGKSPCIVDRTADLEVSARRIAWGKFFNAGQTCVAPDYLLVDAAVREELVRRIGRCVEQFFGADPQQSPDFARIITERHFDRLVGLMGQGRATVGGKVDRAKRYIAPTVITEVSLSDPIMQEEIFGPLLPVLEYHRLDEAIATVRRFEKPLALYLFTQDKAVEERVLAELSFGGGCINNTLVHLSNPHLPFGGVGHSGIGAYHGKLSFDTFSHRKAVVKSSVLVDPSIRYQPYGAKLKLLRRFLG